MSLTPQSGKLAVFGRALTIQVLLSNHLDTGTYLQAAAAKPLCRSELRRERSEEVLLGCVPLEAGQSQNNNLTAFNLKRLAKTSLRRQHYSAKSEYAE